MEINKNILCYDISMCPKDWTIDKVLFAMSELNVVFYDSTNQGGTLSGARIQPPYFLNIDNTLETKVVDISSKEGKLLNSMLDK